MTQAVEFGNVLLLESSFAVQRLHSVMFLVVPSDVASRFAQQADPALPALGFQMDARLTAHRAASCRLALPVSRAIQIASPVG